MARYCHLCGAGPQAAVEILVELGLRIRTEHTNHQGGKQMTKRTVQRTRSLRTIAAPLIAIALVVPACGSDGPVEEPSITDTLRGRNRRSDM
jgi:hypothetical protein